MTTTTTTRRILMAAHTTTTTHTTPIEASYSTQFSYRGSTRRESYGGVLLDEHGCQVTTCGHSHAYAGEAADCASEKLARWLPRL
jgi:hypothetical protein